MIWSAQMSQPVHTRPKKARAKRTPRAVASTAAHAMVWYGVVSGLELVRVQVNMGPIDC